jgi:hypothetical protein
MDTPIVINNFNRLTTTRKLVDKLSELGYNNIHIIDNNSTYYPLLIYYNNCKCIVKRLEHNSGQLAIYNSDYINNFKGWVAYTDSDIELNPLTPQTFIQQMIEVAEKYNYTKVGLALEISDLPNTPYANQAREWESKYWTEEIEPNVYKAHVDTTFCIIKQGLPFSYEALRIGGNLTARHMPWYNDPDELDEEEEYIFMHSSSEFSTTKRFIDSLALRQ